MCVCTIYVYVYTPTVWKAVDVCMYIFVCLLLLGDTVISGEDVRRVFLGGVGVCVDGLSGCAVRKSGAQGGGM